ncbi:MobF family relaxase [Acidithiobacillus ferriphilus]|uniref:MobF family relaxase n=1 Tax=Acidithiobacillus ferriphilus TaxID=1689834 RepID=UPI002DBF4BD9|nr:MobF family relaxase [Acidithiobacillus ferriphilus]MEB8476241.1 relaxase domain-containing protein [Acidithiobacillus ferriphilus]
MVNFQVISGGNTESAAGQAADYPEEKREQHVARDGSEYETGYFSENGGAPSAWIGSGAEAQGLDGRVAREDLIDGYLGRAKDASGKVVQETGARGGKKETDERRYAMDLTLSAPKSVSIAALAGGDDRLLAAHDQAVAAAMQYAEQHMIYARIGKGGADSEFTGSMTAASYRHETARTVDGIADPQLHSHTLIMNLTQKKDGTWASARLDFGKNNEKFKVLDSIYKAELAKSVREAGYTIEHTADGFEIRGISRDQIEAFSGRKKQIDEALGEHGLTRETSTARQRDGANLATRGKKSQLSDVDQKYEWRERARAEGLDLPGLQENSRENAGKQQEQQITGADAVKSALHHLSERDTLFSETALLDESLKAGLGEVSCADVQKAISERAGGLVRAGEIDRGEGKTEPLFTTKASIFREAEILHRARDGQGKAEALIPTVANADGQEIQKVVPDVSFTEQEINDGKRDYRSRDTASSGSSDGKVSSLKEAEPLSAHRMRNLSERRLDADQIGENPDLLSSDAGVDGPGADYLRRSNDDPRVTAIISDFEKKKGFSLGDGQRAAVALALTTEDRYVGIVGAAGAGKTTSMELIVEQYKAAGYEVIGVAPSAAAAKELESAGCDDTRTLASALLMKQEQKEGEASLRRLYIMDESGMVSAKDMDAFLQKADQEGARSILVGDPLQLAAVEAGSPYAQLLETGSIRHVKIDEIQRQKDPQLREIAQAFANGDAAKGVELARPYMTQVAEAKGDQKKEALAQAAADAYLTLSPAEREKTLLLAGTNDTRQAINQKIREGLKKEVTLGADAVQITALDKLDLTREAATRAERYEPKDPENQVIVKLNQELKDRDGNVEAVRGSQWRVTNNTDGKLTLESFDGQKRELVIDPAKVKLSAYESRKMDLAVGDQVMFRENNKERGVMNGQQAKIIEIDKETGNIIAETKTGERITLNPARAESLDYSYARTVHMSQGATVDGVIYAGEAGKMSTAELGYVALSRERLWLRIITDNPDALCKSLEKFADKQTALKASRTPSPEKLEEIKEARRAAGKDLGRTGDFAKKRAAASLAADLAGPTLGDTAAIPDALSPDLGSDKFTQKVNAAMDKIQGKQQSASNAESTALNTPASARDDEKSSNDNDAPDRQQAEPEQETPPPPPPEPELEHELSD